MREEGNFTTVRSANVFIKAVLTQRIIEYLSPQIPHNLWNARCDKQRSTPKFLYSL